MLTIFVIYWLFQNGANKNQQQDSYQRETVPDKFVFFFSKLVRQKKWIRWAKYVYVCVWDMCWRNFCNFPWWLENVKIRSKIALFSNERHFEIWFPKKKTITFSWSKSSKLHKKDPILHVATTFSLKQGGNKNKPWTHSTPLNHPLIKTWPLKPPPMNWHMNTDLCLHVWELLDWAMLVFWVHTSYCPSICSSLVTPHHQKKKKKKAATRIFPLNEIKTCTFFFK